MLKTNDKMGWFLRNTARFLHSIKILPTFLYDKDEFHGEQKSMATPLSLDIENKMQNTKEKS